jgi:3-oxoacyl-[acyl-carrier protein] reductase
MLGVEEKVVVITGGSRGIGRAAALLFSCHEAKVVINFNAHPQAAQQVLDEIVATGGSGMTYCCDISDRQAVEQMMRTVFETYGSIDVLVNNAGVWLHAPIEKLPYDVYKRTLAINVDGVMHCTEAVVPYMIRQGGGRIINIASTAGQRGEPQYSPYAASKGAVISLTKSHAVELAPHNILVNCVAPGWVHTEMSAEALLAEQETIMRTIPLKRAGQPEEIAWPILFLASAGATYMTGEIMNVNGGSVLCG